MKASTRDRVSFKTITISIVGIGGKDIGINNSKGDREVAGITSALIC